jgi:Glycerol uptake facilitator and related permeases (Major Intrinsic Protein Family)
MRGIPGHVFLGYGRSWLGDHGRAPFRREYRTRAARHSIATGAALITLILMFGAVSGAHFNPLVTFRNASWGVFAGPDVLPYCLALLAGGIAGTVRSHFMFGLQQSRCRVTSEAVPLNSARTSLPLSG